LGALLLLTELLRYFGVGRGGTRTFEMNDMTWRFRCKLQSAILVSQQEQYLITMTGRSSETRLGAPRAIPSSFGSTCKRTPRTIILNLCAPRWCRYVVYILYYYFGPIGNEERWSDARRRRKNTPNTWNYELARSSHLSFSWRIKWPFNWPRTWQIPS